MRVLVLGAYGLIGMPTVFRLLQGGHAVVALGRNTASAARQMPTTVWIDRDIAKLLRPDDWRPLLHGIDAVVNAAGALQDGLRDDVVAVQQTAMLALFAACARAGTRLVVQISAAGASMDAPTLFMRSKAGADAALADLDLDWVVLRPGLVLARAAHGATALLRALAAAPGLLPVILGDRVVRTVHVDDVADAVLRVIERRVPLRKVYDLVEDQPQTLRQVMEAFRAWLGYAPARLVPMPLALARIVFRIGDLLGWLGWRTPMRTTALRQLESGIDGDPRSWRSVGDPIGSLRHSLDRMPSTVQERWFARMWALKAVAIATLAVFWIASGFIALARADAAAMVLTARGYDAGLSEAAVVAGACLDIALGAMVLVRRLLKPAVLGMAATTLSYLAIGSLIAPDLWLDPLGPYVKLLPALILMLVVLAIAEER